jgi:hypothetical protein
MTPRFDGTISFGNILVVLTLVASIIAAWVANRERTFDNRERIIALSEKLEALEVRVRALETAR